MDGNKTYNLNFHKISMEHQPNDSNPNLKSPNKRLIGYND